MYPLASPRSFQSTCSAQLIFPRRKVPSYLAPSLLSLESSGRSQAHPSRASTVLALLGHPRSSARLASASPCHSPSSLSSWPSSHMQLVELISQVPLVHVGTWLCSRVGHVFSFGPNVRHPLHSHARLCALRQFTLDSLDSLHCSGFSNPFVPRIWRRNQLLFDRSRV